MNAEKKELFVPIKETPETDEEKRQKKEDSKKQLIAILCTFFPLLIGFLVFTYFFLNSIEEKAQAERRLEIRNAKRLELQNLRKQQQQIPAATVK